MGSVFLDDFDKQLDWFIATPLTGALGAGAISANANEVQCFRFVLKQTRDFNNLVCGTTVASAGGKAGFGIYNADGSSLLVDSGVIDTSTPTGQRNIPCVRKARLNAGDSLIFAAACDSATAQFRNYLYAQLLWFDFNKIASNPMVGGRLPATLGNFTTNGSSLPVVRWMA